MRPFKHEYFPYLETYIAKVKEDTLVSALEKGWIQTADFLHQIPNEKWNFAYASEKWSVKELVLHVMDTERIFAYRALAFARGESQVLPAFDENEYARNAGAFQRTPESILEEFQLLRASNIHLFRSFSETVLQKAGRVPAGSITVNALGYAICGHCIHHMEIVRERYLK